MAYWPKRIRQSTGVQRDMRTGQILALVDNQKTALHQVAVPVYVERNTDMLMIMENFASIEWAPEFTTSIKIN